MSGLSTNPEINCNNLQLNDVVPVGGSGGVSACTTPNGTAPANCSGGYAKPSWQTGTGVPNDEKRDIPDVSLFASNGFAGSLYIVCEADQSYGSCSSTSPDQTFLGFGGTSVSSPAFAGIMALVNQETGSRQGNANYVFYKLAAKDTLSECNSSSKPASSCIFNDVTSGTNAMPCATGSPNCTTSITGDQYGILTGYNAGTGYDLATGLGSVNANNLVMQWSSVSSLPSTTTLNSLTPTTITHGQAVNFSVTVKPTSGSGTPTGQISLLGGASNDNGIGAFSLAGGSFSGTTELLPGGTYSVTAHYAGDGTYGASNSSPVNVTVNKENSQAQVFLVTFDSNGSIVNGDTNTAGYGSPYILRVNVENSAGVMCSPVNNTGATACPSGTVTMTDNGTTLDAGTYTLNSYGYFEDLIVQLPGGTDSVKAAYAGDNSFNASSTTSSLSITPAPTTMSVPYVQSWSVDTSFLASVGIQAQSFGAAPTGTVSFFVNGNPVSGIASYSGTAGSLSNPTATLTATFNSSPSAFPSAGNNTITASYRGDGNYGGSNSAGSSISVKYPSPLLSIGPASLTVAAGASVTVIATVDTFLKNVPVPTGPVPFIYWGPMLGVAGTETYSTITDSNGNVSLQASLTFVPAASASIAASYAGDSNYPSAGGGGLVNITVTGSDFALVPSGTSATVTPGAAGVFEIYVQGQSNYAGTINFSSASCSGLPAESACNFSPASLAGAGYTNLTITTTAPHALAANLGGHSHSTLWLLGIGIPFAALLLPGPSRRQAWRSLATCVVLGILCSSLGCGGSSGNGGGGGGGSTDPGTPSGTYPVTITATSGSGSSATTHSLTLTLIVQ